MLIYILLSFLKYADMAELADALASGASGSNLVEVQVLLSAPIGKIQRILPIFLSADCGREFMEISQHIPYCLRQQLFPLWFVEEKQRKKAFPQERFLF